MRNGSQIYRFGPFELDAGRRRLVCGRDPVWLPDRQMDMLILLVANAGQIVPKETLFEEAWHGLAVDDNSIAQAISRLRRALGNQPDGGPYIETSVGQGYRFVAPVERGERRAGSDGSDALLEPYRAFVNGHAALETLDRDAVARARRAFADALSLEPEFPAAAIGMANACVLAFESTRVDDAPDREALQQAEHYARAACRLDPSSAEAWSTLAVVRYRKGDASEALVAARKAVSLEPDNWHHHVRMAWASWGEERLRAARRALDLCPGLALGHWFAATVFVARSSFDKALDALRAGCASQDAQRTGKDRLTAVGLHLLHGLVLAALGATDAALEELKRELACEDSGHVYARECAANTWYAIGVLHLRLGRLDQAQEAFHQALTRVPGHPLAAVGFAAASPSRHPVPAHGAATTIDSAIVYAAVLALQGKHDAAARLCGDVLGQADAGSAGWLLPVEPLLNTTAHPEAWAQTWATLRQRAV